MKNIQKKKKLNTSQSWTLDPPKTHSWSLEALLPFIYRRRHYHTWVRLHTLGHDMLRALDALNHTWEIPSIRPFSQSLPRLYSYPRENQVYLWSRPWFGTCPPPSIIQNHHLADPGKENKEELSPPHWQPNTRKNSCYPLGTSTGNNKPERAGIYLAG